MATANSDTKVAKALAHPLRLRILGVLEERVASPKEIADELAASLGVVSYHVRVLAGAHLLELVETRARRGATQHYYRAVSRPLVGSFGSWEEVPDIVKDRLIGAMLGEVSAQVNAAARGHGFQRGDAQLTRSSLILDEEGFAQAAAKVAKLRADLATVSAACERRLARSDHHGEIRATAVLMLFEAPLAGS